MAIFTHNNSKFIVITIQKFKNIKIRTLKKGPKYDQ